MTPTDKAYIERRAAPREAPEPKQEEYTDAWINVVRGVLLAASALLVVLGAIVLL